MVMLIVLMLDSTLPASLYHCSTKHTYSDAHLAAQMRRRSQLSIVAHRLHLVRTQL